MGEGGELVPAVFFTKYMMCRSHSVMTLKLLMYIEVTCKKAGQYVIQKKIYSQMNFGKN